MKRETIRNFCIIAHIDHGKSTLADRFIEKAKIVDERIGVANQVLDSMDIERERGITIKSQAVSIPYTAKNGRKYTLNLVDTPGHVDFTYEVSRAISACEGALLLIDASQGVEAQTLANMYLAVEHNLEMIPVINKIDLPSADIEAVKHQINRDLGLDAETAVAVSAKIGTGVDELFDAKIGTGVDELFEKIVELIPPPDERDGEPLRALIFDSHYDTYRGVVVHVRVFSGVLKEGRSVRFMHSGSDYKIEETGVFRLRLERKAEGLRSGDVGYLIAGLRRPGRRYSHTCGKSGARSPERI